MDEIFPALDKGERVILSTAIIGNKNTSEGCTLIFPGQDEATAKKYKSIRGVPIRAGERVLVAEFSGSYIILGTLGTPGTVYSMNKCPTGSNATAANCANWINTMIEGLAGLGIMTKNGW